MAPTGKRVDPHGSFSFLVEIDGITRAAFQEVSGLSSTVAVTEYREGGENTTSRKLPGLTEYSNIVLKRGITDDLELYEWHERAVQGHPERRNGSVVGLDRQGNEVVRWNFFNAWPTKYDAPDFNAEGSDVAVETLEIAHERLERVQ